MSTGRRRFIQSSGLAGLGLFTKPLSALAGKGQTYECVEATPNKPGFNMCGYAAPKLDTVRIGIIGIGLRGSMAVERLAQIDDVEIKALCDIRQSQVDAAITKLDKQKPSLYAGKDDSWRQVCERTDIDLIYIATPWSLHTEMALSAMEHGKHVAVEVPAATTVEDCWRLVLTSERTKKHCVMLENCCYDFFELMTLKMERDGFFGDIVHCEGAYLHDILESFFENGKRYDHWRLKENAAHNGNLYPTHGLGPISQIMKINRGNRLTYMTSMSSSDFSLGKRNKEAATKDPYYRQFMDSKFRGNMNVSNIMTESGSTICLQHDVSSPRPYSRLHIVSGTKAYAQKYPLPAKIAIGHYDFLNPDEFARIEQQYTPRLVKEIGELAKKVGGHGGMDFIMDWRLIYCLRNGLPMDIDVYDAVTWSVIRPLSELSVSKDSQPVTIPDFTMGRYKNNTPINID
ncbi:MAG: Gfo/Idh/MocA family oxidoreductase [Chitinophagaceae bacterium]